MDLYSGIDKNGNLTTTHYDWHHDDQKNEVNAMNATNALNYALAQRQNQWNIEQWQRENEYNSPANQFKLMQEAGLNPLFYGADINKFAGASNVQSADMSVAKNDYVSQEQARMANIINAISGINDSAKTLLSNKQLALEAKRLDIEKQKADSEISLNKVKEGETEAQTKSLLKGLDVSDETIKSIKQSVAESQARVKEINQKIATLDWNNRYLAKTFQSRVDASKLANDLVQANIGLSEGRARVVAQDFINAKKQELLYDGQIKVLDMDKELKEIERDNAVYGKMGDREKGQAIGKAYHVFNAFLDGVSDFFDLPAIPDNRDRSSRNPNFDTPDVVTGESVAPLDDYDKLKMWENAN